jgi:hypothetical protein
MAIFAHSLNQSMVWFALPRRLAIQVPEFATRHTSRGLRPTLSSNEGVRVCQKWRTGSHRSVERKQLLQVCRVPCPGSGWRWTGQCSKPRTPCDTRKYEDLSLVKLCLLRSMGNLHWSLLVVEFRRGGAHFCLERYTLHLWACQAIG